MKNSASILSDINKIITKLQNVTQSCIKDDNLMVSIETTVRVIGIKESEFDILIESLEEIYGRHYAYVFSVGVFPNERKIALKVIYEGE